MGALEYRPVLKGTAVDEIIDVDMLASLAADVLRQRENIQTDLNDKGLKELMSVGTSAGGARAKAVVTLNEITGEIRSGQFDMSNKFTYWLIKFDTEKENKKGYCRIEHAYYEMASACGIDMTECRLLETGENAHFMTKRFDRIGNEKVHMQTLCALAHYDFNVPGKYSYEEMVSVMRKLHMEYEETEQIFRRMVFNVIMKNHDDHTKNFSFLMGKNGKWKLSPAYDVTYAFDPTNYWISKHQMSVNGKIDDIERNDMKKFADLVGIKDPDDIIDSVLSTASEWKGYAKRSGVPKETADAVARNIGV
jgi:serine/threonine-protein kinase HipA